MSEASFTPSGSIDCCLFLFVYLFSVTAVNREAIEGMNAASPPGREREGDSVCFILKLCHSNCALALIISLPCLCFAAAFFPFRLQNLIFSYQFVSEVRKRQPYTNTEGD